MTLARQAKGNGSFGRRGVPVAPAARTSTTPDRPDNAQTTVVAAPTLGDGLTATASRGKAYAQSVLAGATAFIAALFVLTGVDNRFFQAGPMLVVLAVPILPTLAAILYIPTIILSDVARLLSIPRGWADIGIGLALGVGLGTTLAMSTTPADDGRSMMTALAMAGGGFVGGFAFWRAQGYPGAASGSKRALDAAYDKLT